MWRVNKSFLADCARQGLAILLAGCFVSQQSLQAGGGVVTLPTGGAYTAGSGSIKSSGNAVTINQSSLRGIIDWNTFSIGQGGSVTFKNAGGATLNRVNGSQMSSILGSLFASGSVYVLNPQGVLIGSGAHIDTGGDFVASTLRISPDVFMNGGSLVFQGNSPNVVVNLGDIFSQDGSIFLVGHSVQNSGSLTASHGSVGLAAGSEVLLKDSTGDQRVFVKTGGGDATNAGVISAAQVELKAKGGNVYALAANNEGSITATGSAEIDGRVWLISDGGTTQVGGTVAAQNAEGTGGSIETSGHNLDLSQATVKTGRGGNWLLDPVDLTVDSDAAATIENSLATTNVTLQTTASSASGPGTQNASGLGDININAPIAWSANTNLTLDAYHGVTVNSPVTATGASAGLTVKTNDGGAGGFFTVNSPVSLANTASLSINDTSYTLISTPASLQGISSGNYALGSDIDLSSYSFTPIGSFSGTLEGLGHTVSNLSLTGSYGLGLFSFLSGAVENLSISGTINDSGQGAGLLAYDNYGAIYNVSSSGSVTATGTAGGLIGSNSGAVTKSSSSASIAGTGSGASMLGGLIGSGMAGAVTNSYATGPVSAGDYASGVGGLIGSQTGADITNSYASGSVVVGDNSTQVGGLAGTLLGGNISGSYATGAVTAGSGAQSLGGLVGSISGGIDASYATGNVTAGDSPTYVGGLAGITTGLTVSDSNATGNVTAGGGSGSVGGLIGNSNTAITDSYATGSVTGHSNVGGLVGLNNASITGSYAIGAVTAGDGGFAGGLVGENTAPITTSFAAGSVYGGQGADVGGLVGNNQGGGAISISYATGDVSSAGVFTYIGGLVGDNFDALTDTYARGSISLGPNDYGSSSAGGLVGFLEPSGSIARSYSSGHVQNTGLSAAGFVGYNSGGTVTSSYWDADTSGFTTRATGSGSSAGMTAATTGSLQNSGMLPGFNVNNSVWTVPGGVYPYFGWQGPLVAIAGHAYNNFPFGTPIASAGVSALSGGILLGSVQTDVNGNYELDEPQNMTRLGPGVMTYLTSGGTANSYSDGNNTLAFTGMNLYNGSLLAVNDNYSTQSALTAALKQTVGAQFDANILFSSSAGLNLTAGTTLAVGSDVYGGAGTFTLDQSPTGLANAFIASQGLVIAPGQSLTAGLNDSIYLLAGPSFVNNAGAGALNVSGTGRWFVYSTDPADDVTGGLSYSFKQYNATFGSEPAQAAGNGFFYSIAPTITPTLTGTVSKFYDGTTNATAASANLAASGAIDGDSVVLASEGASYTDSKNAGSGKPVTATGISISSATNGSVNVYGYQLASASASGNVGVITPATLTVGGTTVAANKVYDATAGAGVSGGTVSGIFGEDAVSFAQSGSFSDKNAGSGKTVTYTNSISGADAGNYVLSSNGGTLTANIAPATLTVGGTTVAANKVYDATAGAVVSGGMVSGILGDDSVNFVQSGSFADKNAGTSKTVTYTNSLAGTDAGNYVLSSNGGTLTANIAPATLTVGGTTVAASKVYDATTGAVVSGGMVSGVLSDDSVNLVQSGMFADKNAGTGKTVTYANSLTGTDAGNYVLSSNGGTLAANITPATLTVGGTTVAANKTYDATTSASISGGDVSGLFGGDQVNFVQSGVFADKNVGADKAITYSNSITGADAGNYVLSTNGGTLTANITPATLTVGGTTVAANKVYDSTLAATVTGGTITGVMGDDAVNFAQAGSFGDKNAGTNKTVTYANSISGADASNYVLSSKGGTLLASIAPATLTVGGTTVAANKVYDGTLTASISGGSIAGVLGNDQVAFGQTGAFDNKNAGTGKTVTYSNSLSGADSANYVLSSTGGTLLANVTPATLYYVATISGGDSSRPFGTANPVFSGTVTGFAGGDTLASVTSGSAVFLAGATSSSAAGLYSIMGGGLTLSTGNYTLAQAASNAAAFTVLPITISIGSVSRTSGTPNPPFTISYSGPSSDYLKSLLAGLTLVTNAPASDLPGVYQITALVPAALAGSIRVQPGTLIINANNNTMVANNSPQVVATLPASLETQAPAPPQPLPSLGGGSTSLDQFMPANAISQFQVVFTPQQNWFSANVQSAGSNGDALAQASFSETSPDGHSKDNKSTYAAGAQK